jgi:hypothetical protein
MAAFKAVVSSNSLGRGLRGELGLHGDEQGEIEDGLVIPPKRFAVIDHLADVPGDTGELAVAHLLERMLWVYLMARRDMGPRAFDLLQR